MRTLILVCLSVLVFTVPGHAAETPAATIVAQAQAYLQGVDTVKARFIQTAPDGTQRVGTFYLNRPGRMRFDYEGGIKDFVVADGTMLYYYDGELKQTSNAPIGQTIADFMLKKDIKFSGDIRVMGVEEGGGLQQITLAQAADPSAGTLTLGFRDAPYALKKWRVVDPQGQITEVELFDVQQGLALPATLFVYRDPEFPKGKYNN